VSQSLNEKVKIKNELFASMKEIGFQDKLKKNISAPSSAES
jgi:hypothetical protein